MNQKLIIFLCIIINQSIQAQTCISGNCHDGTGTLQYVDVQYIGQFKNGKKEGKGKMTWKDGSYYEGEFKLDNFDGAGTYYDATSKIKSVKIYRYGKAYSWKMADGKKVGCISGDCSYGRGTFLDELGGTYIGQFIHGTLNGEGVFFAPDKTCYVGMFRNFSLKGRVLFINTDSSKAYYNYDKNEPVNYETIYKTGDTLMFTNTMEFINEVLDGFHNNYDDYKIVDTEFTDDYFWISNRQLRGSASSSINRNYIDSNLYTFFSVLFKTKNKIEANNYFLSLVDNIIKTPLNSGSYTSTKKFNTNNECYMVEFTNKEVAHGYIPKYSKLNFKLILHIESNGEHWVVLETF